MLTGNRDTDMEIMQQLDDKDLVSLCQTNRYSRSLCNSEFFWLNRILKKFPYLNVKIVKQYKKDRSWANYYIQDLRKINNTNATEKLIEAVQNNRLDQVLVAINNGANLDVNESVPLNSASENGYLDIVKALVENGANISGAKDDETAMLYGYEEEPLIVAIFNGHLPVVKYLVEKGANIYSDDNTPLKYAIRKKQLPIIKYLLNYGYDLSDPKNQWIRSYLEKYGIERF